MYIYTRDFYWGIFVNYLKIIIDKLYTTYVDNKLVYMSYTVRWVDYVLELMYVCTCMEEGPGPEGKKHDD